MRCSQSRRLRLLGSSLKLLSFHEALQTTRKAFGLGCFTNTQQEQREPTQKLTRQAVPHADVVTCQCSTARLCVLGSCVSQHAASEVNAIQDLHVSVLSRSCFSKAYSLVYRIALHANFCFMSQSPCLCMQAAKDYEEMAAELHKHTQLSNMFDCPEAVVSATEGVFAIKADLVLVKDVWDASSLVEQQFQVCWAAFVMVSYKAHLANVLKTFCTRTQHACVFASSLTPVKVELMLQQTAVTHCL